MTCFYKLSTWGSSLLCVICIPRVFPSFAHLLFPSIQSHPSRMQSSGPLLSLSWVPFCNLLTKALRWSLPYIQPSVLYSLILMRIHSLLQLQAPWGQGLTLSHFPTISARYVRYLLTIWRNIISNLIAGYERLHQNRGEKRGKIQLVQQWNLHEEVTLEARLEVWIEKIVKL